VVISGCPFVATRAAGLQSAPVTTQVPLRPLSIPNKPKEVALQSTIKVGGKMDKVDLDLLQAFTTFDECNSMFGSLVQVLDDADPAVAVLTLEGLYRIESDVDRGQFPSGRRPVVERIRNFLRKWRCESPLSWVYLQGSAFLRSLTVFTTLEVPLFIDNYGKRELLSSYGKGVEDVLIDGETPIFHVTHSEEAKNTIDEKMLKPSDNKNSIEGCWFGLANSSSVYGSTAFKTTLSKLGVTGLCQGEIVSYKKEVNVILYAEPYASAGFEGLKKPSDDAVKQAKRDSEAYVKISIFVAGKFLPDTRRFWEVVSGPFPVDHGPFCVREKRTRSSCKERI